MAGEAVRTISNIRVGKPDVAPEAPSHVRGVFEGNHPHPTERPKGIEDAGERRARGTARRSTSIKPGAHDVIDPRMPRLSPS